MKMNMRRSEPQGKKKGKNEKTPGVKIIPLGGLDQIGMNITAIEYEDTIVVIDCGLAFPEEDMLGIDLVIPDVSYLKENADKVKGLDKITQRVRTQIPTQFLFCFVILFPPTQPLQVSLFPPAKWGQSPIPSLPSGSSRRGRSGDGVTKEVFWQEVGQS